MPDWLPKLAPMPNRKPKRSLLKRKPKPTRSCGKPRNGLKLPVESSNRALKLKLTRLLDRGRQDAEAERNRVLAELRGEVGALAIAAAQKILAVNLDESRQHALLDEFFSGVRSGKITLLEKASLSGDSADVTSALPLTETEQTSIKKDILARVKGTPVVNFRVDPSILGGLIVKVGDTVLDGSVVGQLQDLKQNLK